MPTQPTLLIHNARLISGGQSTEDAWVAFSPKKVVAVGTGSSWQSEEWSTGAELFDAEEQILAPGYIDIHSHGGGGFSFDDGSAAITAATKAHLDHGTTRQLISLVAAPPEQIKDQLRDIAVATEENPHILGSHIEGLFINPRFTGANDAEFLAMPTPALCEEFFKAGGGALREVTVAPEIPGGMEAIEFFAKAGVVVSIGHTDADYALSLEAFRNGASVLTHAFNAMNPMLHRAPGPVVAALDTMSVAIEIVADGVHVHPSMIRVVCEGAPGRVALVTDAMAAAAADDGEYLLGSLPVVVVNGVAKLESGRIAGSTLTLSRAVRQAVTQVGMTVEEAIRAATEIPARALGLENRYGSLAPKFSSDAILLDQTLHVQAVWRDAERVR